MVTRAVWMAGLVGLSLVLVMNLPAADETNPAGIKKLIDQLGADTFADREAASKALDKLGSAALEELRQATTHRDAEVRKRALDLVSRIENRVGSARVLTPTLVRLVYKDTPLKDALEDFRKQSGYDLVLHDPENKLRDKKVTLDTGKVAFWTALDRFCEAAGLNEADGHPGGVGRVPPRAIAPRAPIAVPLPAPAPVPLPAPVPPVGGAKKAIEREEANPADTKPAAPKKEDPATDAKKGAKKEEEKPARGVNVRVAGGKVRVRPGAGPAIPRPAIAIAPAPGFVGNVGGLGQIVLTPGKPVVRGDAATSIRVRAADRKRHPVPPTDKEYGFVLEVSLEPRLSLHTLTGVQIDRAIDDNDQKLTQADDNAGANNGGVVVLPGGGVIVQGRARIGGVGYYPPSPNGLHHYRVVKVNKGDQESKKLKTVEGTITAQVLLEKQEMVVVDSPTKAAGKTFKGKTGGTITINAVTKQANGITQIEFDFEPAEGMQPETRYQRGKVAAAANANAQIQIQVAPGAGAAQPAIGIVQTNLGTFYTPWGLTLVDEKGNLLQASIHPDYRKGRVGGVVGAVVNGKTAFLATYRPNTKTDAAEPAKLVYTARKMVPVAIPFKLSDVDLK